VPGAAAATTQGRPVRLSNQAPRNALRDKELGYLLASALARAGLFEGEQAWTIRSTLDADYFEALPLHRFNLVAEVHRGLPPERILLFVSVVPGRIDS